MTALVQSQYRTLFAYHWHTTQHLMAHAEKLSADDYLQHPGYGRGSIHDLLFHVLRADQGWRLALESGRQTISLRPDDFPGLQTLKAGFEQEQRAWETFLRDLPAKTMAGHVALTTLRGTEVTFAFWRVLHHLVLHGMQHHTEIAQLLTAKGQSPGDIDFIFYQG